MYMQTFTKEFLSGHLLYRADDTHKGDYGHLCLVCGCDCMPGAASLATGAALKSGCGLVTLHTSSFAAQISAVSNPSAILSIDRNQFFSDTDKDWSRYTTVAIGPGIGQHPLTADAFALLMENQRDLHRPMVIDADALNLIAADRKLLGLVPEGSILTPHAGELSRLISWKGDDEKGERTQRLADELGCHIVSKGYHTRIYLAGHSGCYENTTGNPGMAKGGSGDVLTGLIGGLMARGYDSAIAAMLGVWIHGYAGDRCRDAFGMEAFNSRDLISNLYLGFQELYITIT